MSHKKKQETTGSQNFSNSNSYGYMTPPSTPGADAVRDFQFTADPGIGHAYGHAKQALQDSYNNPLGGYYSPNMRDSQIRAGIASLGQGEAEARSQASQQLQGAQFGQKLAYAGLTNPQLVNTGSSGSGSSQGTATQSGGLLGDILIGASAGAGQGAAA